MSAASAQPVAARPRVAIVGAGFGGITAARRLEKVADVTLIDRHNYHSFLPLLYQVATAGLAPSDVGYPVRGIFWRHKHVMFRQGDVEGIDWDRNLVLIRNEDDVPFDHVIISAGATANFFGVPGAEAYALPLYTMSDALRVRNHLLSLFEAADAVRDLIDQGVLNFVVVGGGPTGVEVAGAIAELVRHVLDRDFHDIDLAGLSRVILVEQGDALLTPFDPKLRNYTAETLTKMGVEVRLQTAVARIEPDHVEFADGTTLPTRMVVWAAGVRAGDVAGEIGAEQGRGGRIKVGSDLSIPGHPNAYAIGDIADIADGNGGSLPQLAQVALQGGKFAADQIKHTINGQPRDEFRYKDKGIMATIGRRAAVAQLSNGTRLRGFFAWLAWLGLHLVFLMGVRNRIAVFWSWSWNYLTWNTGPRLILNPEALPHSPRRPPDAIGPAPAAPTPELESQ